MSALVLFPLVVVVVCPSPFLGRGTTMTRAIRSLHEHRIRFHQVFFIVFENIRADFQSILRCTCSSKGINIQSIALCLTVFSFFTKFCCIFNRRNEIVFTFLSRDICLIFCHKIVSSSQTFMRRKIKYQIFQIKIQVEAVGCVNSIRNEFGSLGRQSRSEHNEFLSQK